MNLEEKQKIVEDLHDRFSRSAVVIVTDYKGLDVETITGLRRKLNDAGVEYRVVKNTLLVRAAEETDVALIRDVFKGPSAVALSYDDPVAPAKVLVEFVKDHEKLEIKSGVLNGKVLDNAAVKALADLPSRDVMLSRFLSAANGVPTNLVRLLNAVPGQMVNLLQAIRDKKEQEAA